MKSIYWKSYSLTLIFLAFFLADSINKYAIYYDQFQLKNVVLFIKLPIIIFISFCLVFSKNKAAYSIISGVIILIINYLIGHYFLSNNITEFVKLILDNLKTLVWYLLIFFFIAIYQVIDKGLVNDNLQKFIKYLDYFVIIQCLSVIIGIISDIYYFKSYGNTRFGYSGIFINVMQGNYIYILLILFYFFKINHYNLTRDKMFFWSLLIFSTLIGTKNILLFNILIINYYLYKFGTNSFLNFKLLPRIIFSILVIVAGVYFVISKSNLYSIYLNKGFLDSITSNRYSLVTDTFIPFIKEKWNLLNYLFGGARFNLNRTEFELIDFLWFFGVIGTYIYFSMINKYLIKIKYFVNCVPLLFLSIIILLTGSFFSSLTTVLVFSILIVYILENKLLINNE